MTYKLNHTQFPTSHGISCLSSVYVQSPTNCMYSITLGVLVCACMRFAWRKSFIAVEFYNHPFIAIENYRFPSLPSIWNF